MGFYIKLLVQPIISIFSLIKLFYRHKMLGIDFNEDDCKNFNRAYYYTLRDKNISDQKTFGLIGKQYLQGMWGMVKYPDNSPAKPQSEIEVLYASLGEVRNRDLHLDSGPFELAANGILENNLSLLNPVTKKPTEIMNFRPEYEITSYKALAFISMLTVLNRAGHMWVKTDLYPKYLKLYKLFILMPDFTDLEFVLVSYHILHKYSDNIFLKKWIKLVVMLLSIMYCNKMNGFSKFIAKEIVNGTK